MKSHTIESLVGRINRLEQAVFGNQSVASSKKDHKKTASDGLPAHILRLKEQGFFKQPQTPADTHLKLKSTYHCERDRVAMALLRLQRRKDLRKTSKVVDKHRQLAYVS
jgi:hypothetical protein